MGAMTGVVALIIIVLLAEALFTPQSARFPSLVLFVFFGSMLGYMVHTLFDSQLGVLGGSALSFAYVTRPMVRAIA